MLFRKQLCYDQFMSESEMQRMEEQATAESDGTLAGIKSRLSQLIDNWLLDLIVKADAMLAMYPNGCE